MCHIKISYQNSYGYIQTAGKSVQISNQLKYQLFNF